jgi:hypothetical protein
MSVVWEKKGEAFSATVIDPGGEPRVYLFVEYHCAGWNWAVWRANSGPDRRRGGRAVTRHGAMWDAEKAASLV